MLCDFLAMFPFAREERVGLKEYCQVFEGLKIPHLQGPFFFNESHWFFSPWNFLGSITGAGCHFLLDWEDPLEEGMATHFSILAWRIPWTEESGG